MAAPPPLFEIVMVRPALVEPTLMLPKDADDIQKVKPAHGRRTQQGESRPPLLFARADSSLYTSLATLPQRAGVPASLLHWMVFK